MIFPKVVLFISTDEESIALFNEAVGIIDPGTVRLQLANNEAASHYLCANDSLLPDIIFLDTRYRPESAASLAGLAAGKQKGSAIAVFSNQLTPDDQNSFAAAGVDFYLLKPKTLIQMAGVLQHVFTRCQERIEKLQRLHQMVA